MAPHEGILARPDLSAAIGSMLKLLDDFPADVAEFSRKVHETKDNQIILCFA